jgi:uncharacterized repeat protein (TIGR01451 family)
MDGVFGVIVRVENTDIGPDGDAPVVTLTAESQYDTGTTDAGVYTTTINSASVTVSVTTDNPNPQPGETITYTICVDNGAGAATAYNVIFSNLIPTYTSYVLGSILLGITPLNDAVDFDGDNFVYPADGDEDAGDFGGTAGNTVTVFLGDIAAGEELCVSFTVLVDDDVPVGTVIDNDPVITYENEGGEEYDPVTPPDGGGNGDETIAQLYAVSITTSDATTYTGDPSDEISFEFTVTNDGNGNDSFELTDGTTSTDLVWVYYIDADHNGVIEGSELTTPVTNTGTLTQSGTTGYILVLAVGTIPAGTADQNASTVTYTATSDGDTQVSDTQDISVTVTAPFLKLFKTVSDDDQTDVTANSAAPGVTLTYTVVVQNWGTGEATDITVTDDFSGKPVSYVAESATGGDSASESSGVVTWTITSIAGDSNTGDSTYPEVTLTFQVTVD